MRNKPSGIYQIKNLINGKVYIGSALNINNRWLEHRSTLRRQKHRNVLLQRAWDKYGEESFKFMVLETVQQPKNLIAKEQAWFDQVKPFKREHGYNINPVAGSNLGKKWPEEQREKMSKIMTGRTLSKETRLKISEAQRGKTLSTKHKENISQSLIGEKNPFYGKTHTEESKKKMSKKRKGELAWNSKLTLEQVYEIRKKYIPRKYSQYKLAEEYGVTRGCIGMIINNKSWRENV